MATAADAADTAPPGPAHEAIAPSRRLITGFVLAFANFMVVLDLTIANVSIPHIAGSMGITLEQGAWVVTSYAIAEAICVPLSGWLARRFGAVRLFVGSILGFGLFSLLCGLSTTLGMLVAFRVGQGLCGAPIMPMSQTLMVQVFPPESRVKALAAWSMTVTLAPALGPMLGGFISDELSWHWIFLINVPIALLLAAGGFILLRPADAPGARQPIDLVGLVLMIVWIGSLQIILDTGHARDWFADRWILTFGIVAAVGFVAFVIWELTDDHPIVDLRIFRHRGFTISVTMVGLAMGAFFAGTVVVPQWLQTSLGYSATVAGSIAGIHAYLAVMVSVPAARLSQKIDVRLMVGGGLACLALSMGLRSFWTADADYWTYAMALAIQGIGIPFLMISLTNMSLMSVEPSEVASAAGIQNFVRTLSFAISASIALTFWEDSQRQARTEIVSRLQPEIAQSTLAGQGLGSEAARNYIAMLAQNEAVTMAINHVFALATTVMVASAFLILLLPNRRKAG